MGQAMAADFSKFGKSFQEGLSQLILQDRPFADQICEVLDISYFELKYLQVFVEKIIAYKDKYNSNSLRLDKDNSFSIYSEIKSSN